jgi:hypothetical protein
VISQCNGSTEPFSSANGLRIGGTSAYYVTVNDAAIQIAFMDVQLNAVPAVTIAAGSVSIVASGFNRFGFSGSNPTTAAVSCASSSNVSVSCLDGGSFTVTGSVGIGAGSTDTCNSLQIVNGTITASGGYGAGIGTVGVVGAPGNSRIRSLTVLNGTIDSRSSSYGAGIGTGLVHYSDTRIDDLTIVNGSVTAISSLYGAGIGSGRGDRGNSTVENLTILNGTIIANGSVGAGIGAGHGLSGNASVASLGILGGNITAESQGSGSGIGSGFVENGNATVDSLTIGGGQIVSLGRLGAGIGSGSGVSGRVIVESIAIIGGNISAVGLANGAGIGSGYGSQDCCSSVGRLTITDATVTARGSFGCAGIGSGYANGRESTVTDLAIWNSSVLASGESDGVGIGSGLGIQSGRSTVGTIMLSNVSGIAHGCVAGIASSGDGSEVGRLLFSGRCILACNASSGEFAVNATSILLSNASVVFTMAHNRIFATTPHELGQVFMAILYDVVTTENIEPLSGADHPFLQIGNVSLPVSTPWLFCVSAVDGLGSEWCFDSGASVVRSILVSISNVGNYSIGAASRSFQGFLERFDGSPFFEILSISTFVDEARFQFFRTLSATPAASRTMIASYRFGRTDLALTNSLISTNGIQGSRIFYPISSALDISHVSLSVFLASTAQFSPSKAMSADGTALPSSDPSISSADMALGAVTIAGIAIGALTLLSIAVVAVCVVLRLCPNCSHKTQPRLRESSDNSEPETHFDTEKEILTATLIDSFLRTETSRTQQLRTAPSSTLWDLSDEDSPN